MIAPQHMPVICIYFIEQQRRLGAKGWKVTKEKERVSIAHARFSLGDACWNGLKVAYHSERHLF